MINRDHKDIYMVTKVWGFLTFLPSPPQSRSDVFLWTVILCLRASKPPMGRTDRIYF